MIRIVAPVSGDGQDPVDLAVSRSKRSTGGPLGAAREAPEWRSVVLAGASVSAEEYGVDYTPVIYACSKRFLVSTLLLKKLQDRVRDTQ